MIPWVQIIWDIPDDLDGNLQHIDEHGVSKAEVEDVLLNWRWDTTPSRSSDNQITFGYTTEGRYLAVIWELVSDDPLMIYPVTAYDVPEPRDVK